MKRSEKKRVLAWMWKVAVAEENGEIKSIDPSLIHLALMLEKNIKWWGIL